MEIFMRNIPIQFDKHDVKCALAQALHEPHFFNRKRNFDVHLFRPKPGAPDCTGIVMIPDLSVGNRFLEACGPDRPSTTIFIDGNRIFFSESKRPPPSPDFVETINRTPWVDPAREREREEREKSLSQIFVTLQSIQFGWMCRDDVFSIESEARRPARLRFDYNRRELVVTVQEAYSSTTEYVIATRSSSIMGISCHSSEFDGHAVIFLQLEIPPTFFNRGIPFPGVKKLESYQRLTTFPLVNNPAAIPYTSLAMRLVLLSPSGIDAFALLSELANLRNIVKSYPVKVARRDLFSRNRLERMDISIRQIDSWPISFQLEAMVRNLYVDPSEIMEIIPTVKNFMQSHGKPFVAKALKYFAPLAKEFLHTNASSSMSSYFESFIQGFGAQGDLESEAPHDPNFYSSLHVTITPTSMFLSGPYVDKSNRVIRRYGQAGQENFLRVEFRDENSLQFRFDKDVDDEGFIKARVGPIMEKGLVIAGRRFVFLAYSQSALKEHSVWFVKTFYDPTYGVVTAERIIQNLGRFRDLEYDRTLELCPARYGARISQAFSATDAAVVNVDEILICGDITTPDGRYIFTDGSGGMSKELAREIWHLIGRKQNREDEFPHAYQIRFKGSKGMISVDYTLNGSNVLALRDSMIKFDAPDSREIEISRAIDQPTTYFLNRPLIMILEGLGVPYQVFQDFQDRAVRETKAAAQSLSAAAHLFQTHGLGLSFKLPSTMHNLANLDLENLSQDPFFGQALRIGVYHVLRDLKHRARIPIPNAWTLVGVADTHQFLEENQVFVCIKHTEKGVFFLEGPVLISRSPTIHPGDVQLARAIGTPPSRSCFSKEPLPNTVVFSVKGERPLPTCLGGGDLDGDPYNIIPLTDHPYFAPKRTYKPAEYLPPAKEFLSSPCTMADVANFVMKYIISDVVGIVANNWLVIADQKGSITNPECLKLAKLHSDAVDYQKTGRKVELHSIPKARFPRPDWSAPETMDSLSAQDGKYYRSDTALGKLTRKIDLSAHEPVTLPRVRPQRAGRTAGDRVDDLAKRLPTLHLGRSATRAILDIIEPLVARFINPHAPDSPNIFELISLQFRIFGDDLKGIASRYSLSYRLFKPLSEEELIVGTITQKTSQPNVRKDKIAKLKEATDQAFRKIRDALEGDDERSPGEYLRYAWSAWRFSMNEMQRGTFGAKAFWWISIGTVFDAMKLIEDSEISDVRSTRSRGSRSATAT